MIRYSLVLQQDYIWVTAEFLRVVSIVIVMWLVVSWVA